MSTSSAPLSKEEKMARRINSQLHIVTPGYYNQGWFSSLASLVKSVGMGTFYSPHDRPPFPILMDRYRFIDVLHYMHKGDVVIFGTFYTMGILTGYLFSRRMFAAKPRLILFHGISHMFNVIGLAFMFLVPCYRIEGYFDNGLRWKRPTFKKYDFTKEMYSHPIYKHFKVQL